MSLGLHALLAAIAALIVLGGPLKLPEKVDITVLEQPKAAAAPDISQAKPKQAPPKESPRAIYGLSRKALTANDGEVLKAGNTVAKVPDEEKLKPGDADSLPTPTDEYLVTRMPELASEARIPYPSEAQKKGVEGPVVMDILIDQDGAVREAKLVSGPGSGLNEMALAAVRNFKFKPALLQDKPVAVRIRYAYRFVLQR